jgi:hypothetical protein
LLLEYHTPADGQGVGQPGEEGCLHEELDAGLQNLERGRDWHADVVDVEDGGVQMEGANVGAGHEAEGGAGRMNMPGGVEFEFFDDDGRGAS